ncbi:hypothetical protein EJ110_NYTH00509 [Nymphaea thermarum]|nr:hypothetical protein EJ110_NYTH00509 [Nymphaea thermarum]
MASVLAGSGKPFLSELTSVPNATNGRGRSESARLTISKRQAQEHKPMVLNLRRQAVIGMTASFAAILLSPPSEAKVSKAENKKKVLEKLRQLREKAGLILEPKKGNSSTGEVEEGGSSGN